MKKIVIADDEPHVLRVLKLSLEKERYEVNGYPNGKEALAHIERDPPDILISDIQMPQMNGEELCQYIHQHMPERKFLIFILTSRTEIEHREWSREIGNLQFLEKPVSIRNLIEKIDAYFTQGSTDRRAS